MQPRIADRSSYIEVEIGLSGLRGGGVIELLTRAIGQFGRKHILVLCDDPGHEMSLEEAYRAGVEVSKLLQTESIAIVLRGRHASENEHFTELVAANRGARVRYFESVASALSWLSTQ